MKKIEVSLLASFLALVPVAWGADPAGDFVNGYLKKKQIPGCAVMVPESETSFFEEDSERTFRFAKDDSGHVTAFVISVPEELTLRRLP